MQVRNIKPGNFLFHRELTTIDRLHNYVPVGQKLYREAVNNDLSIMGAIQWHYFDFTGDVSKPFTLEVSLPVATIPESYDGTFHFKRTERFECVSAIHSGAWSRLPETYQQVFEFIQREKLVATSMFREVYMNADFIDGEANVTEVQAGIQTILP